jgi:hypothetical protein
MNLRADENCSWAGLAVAFISLISVGQSLNKAALCLQRNYL